MILSSQTLHPILPHQSPHSPRPILSSSKPIKNNKTPTPSSSEFATLLRSCIETRSLQQGKALHSRIIEAGFGRNRDLLPRLLKLYFTCNRASDARKLFDEIPHRNRNVYIYTSMVSGYLENQMFDEAFDGFFEMLEYGVKPDSFTFSALMKACVQLGSLDLVVQLHCMIVKLGYGPSDLSVANSLINAYGCFEKFESFCRIFEDMPMRDVVSWTSMIQACNRSKRHGESMELLSKMQFEEGLKPNALTVVSVLPACAFFASLKKGQAIHAFVMRNGLKSNAVVAAALISMYSQCGKPDDALVVFDALEGARNVVVWTSMIEGLSMNGRFDEALRLFEAMQVKPNRITLVVVLSACSHGGLLEEGRRIFDSMNEKFGIEPRMEHYACVVDMLGRAGRFDEAEDFIECMKVRPNGSVYGALLGACQVHRNVKLGERVAHKLFELELNNAGNYVMLSNLYASTGRWEEVGRLRAAMIDRGLFKSPGCSWLEMRDKVFVFGADERADLDC
ncbi:putative pentatricopeptide repeat-containing protein [Acorus calamus]|uniref:Pentatricopeptide repeat-containing protein n=1 Tax=Acorus calamus TaxID=4465 RepID=A0AAV9EWQ1_ACOCL|nr:putative pentatricopeptide repeat-containing protein [Acorus calamus]